MKMTFIYQIGDIPTKAVFRMTRDCLSELTITLLAARDQELALDGKRNRSFLEIGKNLSFILWNNGSFGKISIDKV